LPLVVGIIAILGTNGVLGLLSQATDVSIFAQNLTTALGLGLAIDYALFIVRRFREELGASARPGRAEVAAAVGRTLATAGRTVLFSAPHPRRLARGDAAVPDVLPPLVRVRRHLGGPASGHRRTAGAAGPAYGGGTADEGAYPAATG